MMPADPVVGGTVLRRAAIQSPNFETGVQGWTINADGSAEFNNLAIRGTFNGTDFTINASGAFFYSPSEGAGNLIASIAPAGGTDGFGNHYLQGTASYQSGFANAMIGGSVLFYTGTLAGGWTFQGQVEISGGTLIADFGAFETTGTAEFTGNVTCDSQLTVQGNAAVNGGTLQIGAGSLTANNFNMASPMATPPNAAAVNAGTATTAQLCAFAYAIYSEMKNRGMFN